MTAPTNTIEDEARYVMGTFRRQPLELVGGKGFHVFDADGKRYLDFVAGIAVNVLGHGHQGLVDAISTQARTMIHTSNLYYTANQVDLARRLNDLGFAGRAFFGNSGAEANEAAIKVARKWGQTRRNGAFEVISAEGSFHGRTLATVAATGQPRYREPFEPMPDGFRQVPFNHVGALRAAVTAKTAAVLLEPIQGESGVVPAEPGYLAAVRDLCDEMDLLLMLDEVQTGMGRTGSFYAFADEGIVPDVVTLAKGLGGGVPIGVCLAGPRADVFGPGDHGSTFGGGPLAAAAALATLDALETEGLIANARETGAYLGERLAALAGQFTSVSGARGRGLMQALVLNADCAPALQAAALDHGLLVNAVGQRVIRMAPPLTVGRREVDQCVNTLAACLDLVAS